MGAFYGRDSVQSREQLKLARWGFAIVFGREGTYHSLIWIEDAAHVVVAALQQAPSGVYDVVDDEPLENREMQAAVAKAVDRRELLRVPSLVLRWSVGAELMEILTRSLRVSNRRFKEATAWRPQVCSARNGWARITDKS